MIPTNAEIAKFIMMFVPENTVFCCQICREEPGTRCLFSGAEAGIHFLSHQDGAGINGLVEQLRSIDNWAEPVDLTAWSICI